MELDKITIQANVSADLEKAWDCYTLPEHIINWNFADPSWHCPKAENDMQIGGTYKARMEAKDGSFGFDFEGVYTKIVKGRRIEYAFGDRRATVEFLPNGDRIMIRVSFDPETTHSLDQQRAGWQSILDNYAKYTSRG